eukprot:Selendium_serpulae@DN10173_c0_g1_i1.p1
MSQFNSPNPSTIGYSPVVGIGPTDRQSVKLEFDVAHSTSEDPEFPSKELVTHSSGRGWLSGRYCEFPQEIMLEFKTPCHLKRIELLSHQSCISSKVELAVGSLPPGQPEQLAFANFKRLGHLTFDDNTKCGNQARELKSVFVDAEAQYLKVSLHK